MTLQEYHQEEERLIQHLKDKHGKTSKEIFQNVRNCCTYHCVEDLWKYHKKLDEMIAW